MRISSWAAATEVTTGRRRGPLCPALQADDQPVAPTLEGHNARTCLHLGKHSFARPAWPRGQRVARVPDPPWLACPALPDPWPERPWRVPAVRADGRRPAAPARLDGREAGPGTACRHVG